MRFVKASMLCGVIAVAMVAYPAAARVRVGVVVGVPGPWYPYPHYYDPYPRYYDPYYPHYYYPPPVVAVPVPTAPPTYVQQSQEASQQDSADNDWYYCAAEKGYYPYVKQCPSGWTRVAPKPQGAP